MTMTTVQNCIVNKLKKLSEKLLLAIKNRFPRTNSETVNPRRFLRYAEFNKAIKITPKIQLVKNNPTKP